MKRYIARLLEAWLKFVEGIDSARKSKQSDTDLRIRNWSKRRLTSLGITVSLYGAIIVSTLYASIEFWSGAAKTPEVGVAFALGIDGLAVMSLIFRVCRIEFPLVWMRHVLPLTTVIPVWLFCHDQFNDLWLAGICTLLMLGFAWVLQRHLEALFISPADLARERVYEAASALLNEQHRRIAVDEVGQNFKDESKALAQQTVLQLPPMRGRDAFRIQYNIAHKHVTEAYTAYRNGADFSRWVRKKD